MHRDAHAAPVRACLLLALLAPVIAGAMSPKPARHGDFGHYTFALTWQPGFCSTDEGCLRDEPRESLIGLHGLWASRPRALIARGISAPKWWRHGCDCFHHSDRAPRLSAETLGQLRVLMPHLKHDLLRHEFDKHVQCFSFDAESFFDTELRVRRRVVESPFGHYLMSTARGRDVRRKEVIAAFAHAFDTRQWAALQLRCGHDHRGRVVLTQLWITLHADALARFPGNGSLMNAPIAQSNCPRTFRVPVWR